MALETRVAKRKDDQPDEKQNRGARVVVTLTPEVRVALDDEMARTRTFVKDRMLRILLTEALRARGYTKLAISDSD